MTASLADQRGVESVLAGLSFRHPRETNDDCWVRGRRHGRRFVAYLDDCGGLTVTRIKRGQGLSRAWDFGVYTVDELRREVRAFIREQ